MTSLAPSDGEDRCPHCGVTQHYRAPTSAFSILDGSFVQASGDGPPEPTCHVALLVTQCRTCRKTVVDLLGWSGYVGRDRWMRPETVQRLHPRRSGRPPVPPEVSANVREWYEEAATAEAASPRAGLALARVCLQVALRDRGIDGHTLFDQIDCACKDPRIAGSSLAPTLLLVRDLEGRLPSPGARSVGAQLSVELEEADAAFAALREIFEQLYVTPRRQAELAKRINAKLGVAEPARRSQDAPAVAEDSPRG